MQSLWGMLREEGCLLWRTVREAPFLSVIVLSLLLYALVLQFPFVLNLDVGAGPEPPQMNSFDHLVGQTFGERVGRAYDLTFLDKFYDGEKGAGFTFRWSEPEARLQVQAVAKGPLLLHLRMHGAPAGPVGTTRLEVAGQRLAEFPVDYPLHDYAFVIDPAALSGDGLTVDLYSTSFRPGGGDPRALGVALDRVTLIGWAWGRHPFLPPTALLLAGFAAFVYLGLRRAGLRMLTVTIATSLWVLVPVAGLLLPARPFVAAYAGGLFLAAALSYPVLLVTLRLASVLLHRSHSPAADPCTWSWLAVLFLLVFLLYFGGALSPRYASHDALFHANRLEFVQRGDLFFEHVSLEAGMRSDPYPGALYLSLVPFTVLVSDHLGLLAFFIAWLAGSEVFLVWFLARQVTGARTSRWAALLYAAFPIGPSAYWFGIYTNLFASWVALLLAVAVVLALQRRLSTSLLLWVPLSALFFLAHFGLVILWAPLLLLWGGLLYWHAHPRRRAIIRRLFLAGLLALLLAVVLYYSYFTDFFRGISAAMGSSLSAAAPGAGEAVSQLERTWAELRVWWRWGVLADYAGIGLFAGGLGLLLLAGRRLGAVMVLLLCTVATAIFFWGISMVLFFFTRYMLFLLPVAAIGSAEVLSTWRQRGMAGRVVAAVVLFYVVAMTVALWLGLCLLGLHPPHVL